MPRLQDKQSAYLMKEHFYLNFQQMLNCAVIWALYYPCFANIILVTARNNKKKERKKQINKNKQKTKKTNKNKQKQTIKERKSKSINNNESVGNPFKMSNTFRIFLKES